MRKIVLGFCLALPILGAAEVPARAKMLTAAGKTDREKQEDEAKKRDDGEAAKAEAAKKGQQGKKTEEGQKK